MSYLPSLPAETTLLDVFRAYPDTARPLLDHHERVMRGGSPFTPAERELIAAYVSALNDCTYCHGVHAAVATEFGVADGVIDALIADVDSAPVDERLRPVLRFVGRLTTAPARVTERDARAVFAAGWDERALHDAVLVCALFNFMNRLVDGLGVRADNGYFVTSARRLHDRGYAGLAKLLDG